jgi:hypothetical protein
MAFILWFKTAEKYQGGPGQDRKKHETREAAETAAKSSPHGGNSFDVLPFKKMPKTYCEECDEYRCVCKENAELFDS